MLSGFNRIKIMDTITKLQSRDVFQFEGNFSTKFNFQKVSTYDPVNNYLMAQLCGLSYKTKAEISDQINLWEKNTKNLKLRLVIKDVDSFRFIVVATEDYIIVCFRGSDNFDNWLSDFNIKMVPFNNSATRLVHKGFYDSVISMRKKLDKVINKLKTNKQNVYVTGHSLGGAQAIISSFVCSELSEFTNVTTFGEPKIGNLDLVDFMNRKLNSSPPSKNSRIYRNVNGLDPVPYLPISYWFKLYHHESFFYLYAPEVGTKYEIESSRDSFSGRELIDIPKDQNDVLGWNIIHHSITDYIDNAETNKSNPVFYN